MSLAAFTIHSSYSNVRTRAAIYVSRQFKPAVKRLPYFHYTTGVLTFLIYHLSKDLATT